MSDRVSVLPVTAVADIHNDTFDRARQQIGTSLSLIAWWFLCILLPVVAVVLGAIYGCIVGTASGIAAGVVEAKRDLKMIGLAIGVKL